MKIDRSRRDASACSPWWPLPRPRWRRAAARAARRTRAAAALASRAAAAAAAGTTIQMVTHEQAGDTFWDKIRAGAEDAANGARDHPAVLEQRERPRAGHAGAERDRQQGLRPRRDAVERGRGHPGGAEGRSTPGIPVVAFNQGIDDYTEAGAKMYFGSDELLAGQTVGQRAHRRGRRRQDAVHHPGAGLGRAGDPLRGCQAGLPEHGEPAGQRGRPAVGAADDPVEAGRRTPSITNIVTLGAPIALAAMQAQEAAGNTGQARHVRPQPGGRAGDQGRQDPVLGRPAALRAGLHGGRRRCG